MKENNLFPKFASETRVWIYGFRHSLSAADMGIVGNALRSFIGAWNSHGHPVNGDFVIKYHKFVILCGESSNGISGCSIDSSVRVFKELKEEYGLDALNHHLVHYRCGSQICSVERTVFQELILAGKISGDTVVFNTTVRTLGEVRQGFWETPFSQSWHANAFKMSA